MLFKHMSLSDFGSLELRAFRVTLQNRLSKSLQPLRKYLCCLVFTMHISVEPDLSLCSCHRLGLHWTDGPQHHPLVLFCVQLRIWIDTWSLCSRPLWESSRLAAGCTGKGSSSLPSAMGNLNAGS